LIKQQGVGDTTTAPPPYVDEAWPALGAWVRSCADQTKSMFKESNMPLSFNVHLVRDDGGSVMATCPDFPELSTFGVDPDDALVHARDAIQQAIDSRRADQQDVPEPSRALPGVLQVTVQ
jgi:predicted RNase H-like HicB family nuclease